jgi:hypothetical protein
MRINRLGFSHNRYELIWMYFNKIILKIIRIVFLLVESHIGHKTIMINHINIVANHSINIITKSKQNVIVFEIEYEKQLLSRIDTTTSIDSRAFILAKSNKSMKINENPIEAKLGKRKSI